MTLPYLETICENINLTTSKIFLDPYIFPLHQQELKNFHNFHDNQPFLLFF